MPAPMSPEPALTQVTTDAGQVADDADAHHPAGWWHLPKTSTFGPGSPWAAPAQRMERTQKATGSVGDAKAGTGWEPLGEEGREEERKGGEGRGGEGNFRGEEERRGQGRGGEGRGEKGRGRPVLQQPLVTARAGTNCE